MTVQRSGCPFGALTLFLLATTIALPGAAIARPGMGGGLGGPGSGAGVRPGAGLGAPGVGLDRTPGVGRNGLGGPASGAGVRPGVGVGAPGVGLTRAPGAAARSTWNPAWGRTGYWGARPWRVGWYGVNPVAWNWWAPSSAVWGLNSLATAAAISSQVDQAVAAHSTVFTVPSTSLQLDYGSLQAVAPYGASFTYLAGGAPVAAQVDCQQGWLNGAQPQTADQAQLLNAACLVAYGASP